MKIIEEYFSELDKRWRLPQENPIPLRVIGAGALMLQTNYSRGTKDADILEIEEISGEIRKKLLELAGQGSELHRSYRLYLDIVREAITFLPQQPVFCEIRSLQELRNFKVEALDVTDTVVSKLKRFNANDVSDIRAMIKSGKVEHSKLLERFRMAVDRYSVDARAEDLPKYVKNLHTAERDYFMVPETDIKLPDWLE